jgi:hypothetical protein
MYDVGDPGPFLIVGFSIINSDLAFEYSQLGKVLIN